MGSVIGANPNPVTCTCEPLRLSTAAVLLAGGREAPASPAGWEHGLRLDPN